MHSWLLDLCFIPQIIHSTLLRKFCWRLITSGSLLSRRHDIASAICAIGEICLENLSRYLLTYLLLDSYASSDRVPIDHPSFIIINSTEWWSNRWRVKLISTHHGRCIAIKILVSRTTLLNSPKLTLCWRQHSKQHSGSDEGFWRYLGISLVHIIK